MPSDSLVIPGFGYHENALTADEEAGPLARIAQNAARWEQDYSRPAQRYGYRYDYDANTVARLGPLPDWLVGWAERLRDEGWMHTLADQATVQEYEPGAGSSDHIDDPLSFGPDIVTLSLLSPCAYRLIDPRTKVKFEQLILPRSAVILSGAARKIWSTASQPARATTSRANGAYAGGDSPFTFRTVNPARVSN